MIYYDGIIRESNKQSPHQTADESVIYHDYKSRLTTRFSMILFFTTGAQDSLLPIISFSFNCDTEGDYARQVYR